MPEHIQQKGRGARPQSKSLLSIDVGNAYARLGVSPQASSEEISSLLDDLRSAAVKRLKAKGNTTLDDPDQQEVLRLDKIAEEIGDVRKRDAYNDRHPQNVLLTIQPSVSERAWLRHRRAGLISEWVYGELDRNSLVPTPSCLRLWAPQGVDPELLRQAMEIAGQTAAPSTVLRERTDLAEPMISLEDLKDFSGEK